jgi:hypothetical protein
MSSDSRAKRVMRLLMENIQKEQSKIKNSKELFDKQQNG